jgi:predicted Rossmann-fold nucleotide-binding protein
MKVIVCGSRDFRSPAQVWRELDRLHAEHKFTALMQGGATGVDGFAREWAARKPEVHRYVCHAEWDKFGKAAGPKRNARMLEWKPDLVIAFPGGKGTTNMVEQAEAAGVRVLRVLEQELNK